MSFPEDYAKEVFKVLDGKQSKNAHDKFLKAFEKLCKEKDEEKQNNDVGCPISNDCSLGGCYRYCCCDFPWKNGEKEN